MGSEYKIPYINACIKRFAKRLAFMSMKLLSICITSKGLTFL